MFLLTQAIDPAHCGNYVSRLADGNDVVLEISTRTSVSIIQEIERRPAHPVFLGYPHGPKTAEYVPDGTVAESIVARVAAAECHVKVFASSDSMPCETGSEAILGSQFGKPSNGLYNAIYDRKLDRLIRFDADSVRIAHASGGYAVSIDGLRRVEIDRQYVRNHLGYFFWTPTKLWPEPIAGWCSWMAYLQGVTEQNIRGAAEFFGRNLREYGYDVIQIDDGYQRASQTGEPALGPKTSEASLWNTPNEKFPSGLKSLAHYIDSQGLVPGIWIGLFLPLGLKHADGYITDPNGAPQRGPWVNYAVDGLNSPALQEAYLDSIRGFREKGWRYFKIDTLRHVLYDNYRKSPDFWRNQGQQMEIAYRKILQGIRREAGPGHYVLACWGTIPELAGLVDGCRIGEDVGPNFESMQRSANYIAQFNYLNNVVWHNDPDYMCLRLPLEEATSWATLTALAGGHLMVSDPVEDYDPARLDVLRRVGPPMRLKPNNTEALQPKPEWMTLPAEKRGEQWLVSARFAWSDLAAISKPLAELGLDPQADYLAFDFWEGRFLGTVRQAVRFRALSKGHCQVVTFRELQPNPQVLGTDRHVGQGVVDLDHVKWQGGTLSGSMRLGMGRPWSLFLHVPKGFSITKTPSKAQARASGEVLKITFPEQSGSVSWSVEFAKDDPHTGT